MKINEAIKQNAFASEHEKLQVNIFYTYFWLKEQMSILLKPHGITLQQYNVLRILRGQFPNGITTSDIRSRMLDKMSDASRLVDRLASRDLVLKKTNNADKRLVCVTITDAGLHLLENVDNALKKMGQATKKLSKSEAEMMNAWLDKIREI